MISGELISAVLGVGLGFIFGIITGIGIQENEYSALQEHMAGPEWQTVEAWGAGYAQGFGDSVAMCSKELHKQREMMIEQMEPTLPKWDSAEASGSRTDRHGTPLTRPGGPTLP